MEEDLISVIIPIYNTERYLAACLDSVLTQSYKNIEVILVNDGSTDFSLQIAQSYSEKDDRVTLYNHANEGPSEARNRGLEVATGNFITFVDSDDLLLPNALEILLDFLKTKNADIAEGTFLRGKVFSSMPAKGKISSEEFTNKEAIADVLYQKKLLSSPWGKLYKTSLFQEIRFEKGIIYEDLNCIHRILENCRKVVWIDYPVYFYRDTEGSLINAWKPQRLDVLKVTENIEDYIAKTYPDLLPAAIDRRLSANFNMFALCSIHKDHANADKCWKHIKDYRKHSFFNPKVRLKNKAGILLSYFGKRAFIMISKKIYR